MNWEWLFFLAFLVLVPRARADVIELRFREPGPGAAAPVIWGRYEAGRLTVGADVLRLDPAPVEAAAPAPPQVAAPDVAPDLPAERVPAVVAMTYELKSREQQGCVRSERFRSLLELLRMMRGKVRAVVLRGDAGWEACATAVRRELAHLGVALEREPGRDAALLVQVDSTTAARAPKAAEPAANAAAKTKAPAPPNTKSLPPAVAQALPAGDPKNAASSSAPLSLTIAGKPVALDQAGYFIVQPESFAEVALDLRAPGYRRLQRGITPWPIAAGESAAPAASGVRLVRVIAGTGPVTIAVVAESPSAHAVVFDLVAGGGLSYGHELPNEARGKRFFFATSYSQRDLFAGFGLRGAAAATLAQGSVVPWTLLADALVTRTGALFGDDGTWRAGVGARLFAAKVGKKLQSGLATIPDQVTAPLLELAAEQKFGSVLISLKIAETLLFLPGAGTTTATSPEAAAGYAFTGAGALLVGFRADAVKYPTVAREAALHLDSYYLTWRQGI